MRLCGRDTPPMHFFRFYAYSASNTVPFHLNAARAVCILFTKDRQWRRTLITHTSMCPAAFWDKRRKGESVKEKEKG